MANVLFLRGTKSQYDASVKSSETFYYTTDENKLYIGSELLSNAAEVSDAVTRIGAIETKVDMTTPISAGEATTLTGAINSIYSSLSTLVGNGDGSISKMINDAITTLKGQVVNSITNGDNSVTIGGTATAPTVSVKVSEAEGNALSLASDGLKVTIPTATDYTVTVTESSPEGYAKAYTIAQAATGLSTTINIPSDMVVSSGTVETKAESGAWGDAGTYLVLTLANATSDKVYINVGSLIEYVTAGDPTDTIIVNVSADHKVTASVKNGSIGTTQLAEGVVTSLGKADSAVQSVVAGDNNGEIKVDNVAVKVTGLQSAAYATAESFDPAGEASKVLGKASDASDANTVYGAKKYAEEQAANAKLVWGTIA